MAQQRMATLKNRRNSKHTNSIVALDHHWSFLITYARPIVLTNDAKARCDRGQIIRHVCIDSVDKSFEISQLECKFEMFFRKHITDHDV